MRKSKEAAGSSTTGVEAALRCSFCNKDQKHVKKLIAGPNVFICDECVSICLDIIDEDEKNLLKALKHEARDVAPEFQKLYDECMKA